MDCRACGTVNAPGRRYCRECGGKLGGACPVCGFLNGFDDKHCGGCSRRLRSGGPLGEELPPPAAYAPADDIGFGDEEALDAAAAIPLSEEAAEAEEAAEGPGGQDVSQSEIDGLFENILDDDEAAEGTA